MKTLSSALLALLAVSRESLAFVAPVPSKTLANEADYHNQLQWRSRAILTMSTTEVGQESDIGKPGTANLPWSELGFEFRPTKSHLRMIFKDGKWGEAELVEVGLMYRFY